MEGQNALLVPGGWRPLTRSTRSLTGWPFVFIFKTGRAVPEIHNSRCPIEFCPPGSLPCGGFNSALPCPALPYGQRGPPRQKEKKSKHHGLARLSLAPYTTETRHVFISSCGLLLQYLFLLHHRSERSVQYFPRVKSTNNTRDLRHEIRPRHRIPEPRARRKRRHIERRAVRAVREVQERIIERPRLAVQQEHISTSVSALPPPLLKTAKLTCAAQTQPADSALGTRSLQPSHSLTSARSAHTATSTQSVGLRRNSAGCCAAWGLPGSARQGPRRARRSAARRRRWREDLPVRTLA